MLFYSVWQSERLLWPVSLPGSFVDPNGVAFIALGVTMLVAPSPSSDADL